MTPAQIAAAEYEISSLGDEIRSLRAQKSHLRRWYNNDTDEMQYCGPDSYQFRYLARSAAKRLTEISGINERIARWTARIAQLKAEIAG